MTDDIRTLTAQLAADPGSLVFLRLGEALRQRGQFESAQKVAVGGLARYPHLPDAHDLLARILADLRDYAAAFDEWDTALRLAPDHVGAHKGIGFLYYRAGELESAIEHLKQAAQADPSDQGVLAALARLAGGEEIWDAIGASSVEPQRSPAAVVPPATPAAAPAPAASSALDPFAGLEGGHERLLLVDEDGFRLGGGMVSPDGSDVSETTAAAVTAVAREAGRTARILELGDWRVLTVEGEGMSFTIEHPTPETTLLATMDPDAPAGQLTLYAERAARAAEVWMERMRK